MNTMNTYLNDLRNEVDVLDEHIQTLILRRAECCLKIATEKKKESDAVFYKPERESLILQKVMQRNCEPLDKKQMAMIFRSIMSACLALQKPMNIAFLGPEGTFSEQAAYSHFGPALVPVFAKSIPDIFYKVESGLAHYGVVPIENTSGGLINLTLDQFIETALNICGEIKLMIEQSLLRNIHTRLPIQKIYSHDQSFLQCNKWIEDNYPKAELIAVASNALAAKHAAEEDDAAAIAGKLCADIYPLKIVADNISDNKNNMTRFVVIGQQKPQPSGYDRTSLLLTVRDLPGALDQIITPFSCREINLTMIKSKPNPHQDKSQLFFLDLDIHNDDPLFSEALEDLEHKSLVLKILGSYPKAID